MAWRYFCQWEIGWRSISAVKAPTESARCLRGSRSGHLAGYHFLLPEDIPERANPAGDPKPRRVFPPDLLLLHTLPVFYPHLSVNRGSVPWPTPWKGSGIFFRRCASPLSASRGSFRPVAIGVLLIPMSPLNPGSNRWRRDCGWSMWLNRLLRPFLDAKVFPSRGGFKGEMHLLRNLHT